MTAIPRLKFGARSTGERAASSVSRASVAASKPVDAATRARGHSKRISARRAVPAAKLKSRTTRSSGSPSLVPRFARSSGVNQLVPDAAPVGFRGATQTLRRSSGNSGMHSRTARPIRPVAP